ncbi:GtrA family protein [Massilia sp. 9096]|uniref:GtrA family protein n=1 Tax=Massilia sp. 9096 TaxID=1500894 RepID=UPI000691139D|nr:GtrA family protein [Massilia sp. 9096]
MKQFLRFCVVGALGFVTDFATLYVVMHGFGFGTLCGRLVSFLVAATVTWKVNRHFTFVKKDKGSIREWLHYLMFTGIGGVINVSVYQFWLWATGGRSTLNLFLAVAAGSGVAMMCNFMISKYAVFSERRMPS